jgi:undecaprenyl-diphosphatase
MLEQLLVWERDAFFFLNGSHSPFWDRFMWLYSGKIVWIPIVLFILWVILYKKNWRESLFILLMIALTITLCDQFASGICKPLFTRLRPTHHPDFMNEVKTVYGYRGGMYGFISSHAANAFGFATFLSLLFKYKPFTWTVFFWATLNAYTRIYLGVHFITDIIPGIISGIAFGFLVYYIYVSLHKKYNTYFTVTDTSVLYATKEKQYIIYGIVASILLIALLSKPLVDILR